MTIPKQSEACTFLKGCIQLYEEMLAVIEQCKQEKTNEAERIQGCFEIAIDYKAKLMTDVRAYTFEKTTDEVCFFKKIKPLFSAEVEYYTYCYHVLLFRSNYIEPDQTEWEHFMMRQLQRMGKFKKEHQEFYLYVTAQRTDNDLIWFTRDGEGSDKSLCDGLMGTYLALKRYIEFIQMTLKASSNEW